MFMSMFKFLMFLFLCVFLSSFFVFMCNNNVFSVLEYYFCKSLYCFEIFVLAFHVFMSFCVMSLYIFYGFFAPVIFVLLLFLYLLILHYSGVLIF